MRRVTIERVNAPPPGRLAQTEHDGTQRRISSLQYLFAIARMTEEALKEPDLSLDRQVMSKYGAFLKTKRGTELVEKARQEKIEAYGQMKGLLDRRQLEARLAAMWRESGYQMIDPAPKLAASFMSTNGAMGLEMPWPCFGVKVPEGLAEMEFFDQTGEMGVEAPKTRKPKTDGLVYPIEFVIVAEVPESKAIKIWLWSAGGSTHMEFSGLDSVGTEVSEVVGATKRSFIVCARLINGCIAEMEGGGGRRRIALPSERASLKPGAPKIAPWVLGRPVKLDLREEVSSYVKGGGTPPSVRTLVRGHWRNQAHGPKMQKRKLIHIEPFWRGPEEAAVVVRPHRL